MKDPRITKIVVEIIKERHPTLWAFARKNSHRDDAGNGIYVHDDTIVWESAAWLDYEVLDRINEQIEAQGIEAVAEYWNDYEVKIEAL